MIPSSGNCTTFLFSNSTKAGQGQEVILVDNGASPQQADALLQLFQDRQGSKGAHPNHVPPSQRTVYLVPMSYRTVNGQATLCVTSMHDRLHQVRGGGQAPLKEWTYNGPVTVQGQLQ